MLYKLPATMQKKNTPQWPKGVGSIPAVLPDGTSIMVPVYSGVNYLTIGTTGTGKTSSFTEPAAKLLLDSDPRMKAAFFEVKTSFLDHFLESGDKVITHNPKAVPKGNLFVPAIVKEILQAKDKEAEMRDIADFLFSDLLEGAGQNMAWIDAARDAFIGILRTIVDLYPERNTGNWTLIHALRRMSTEEILAYISKHPRNASMLRKNFNYDPVYPENYVPNRRSTDIMFFLNQVLESFSGAFDMDGEDTIRDWLDGKYGRNLFFFYDLSAAEIGRPFFLYYMKKIKDHCLSNSIEHGTPILMVLDELDKMSDGGQAADWGLFQAANLSRACGLQLLLTTQSVENLRGLSPDYKESIVTGGLAGFPITVAFRPGDPTTLNTLQRLYGSEYREHLMMPMSRYTAPVVQSELQPIVTDAEFASLDTGEAYIKIMNHRPQKVKFVHK